MATALDVTQAAMLTTMQQLTASMQQLVKSTSQTVNATAANTAAAAAAANEADAFADQLTKNRKLSEAQQKLLQQALDQKKKEIAQAALLQKAKQDELAALKDKNATEAHRTNLTTIRERAEKDHLTAQTATTKAVNELESSFGGLTKTTKLTNAALAWFGVTLAAQSKELIKQYRGSGGAIEGANGKFGIFGALLDQQNEALKRGLSGSQFQEMSMEMRQTVNAMGGTQNAFQQLDPAIDNFRKMTLDSASAMKMTVEATKYFANSGVKPTADNMEAYRQSLVQLTAQTGLQGDAAQAYFKDIASDADSISLLRRARKDERDGILASQRAMVLNAQAAGMNAEQAKEATKMLAGMVAQKPLDRLKQAAKIRALGGAMGIEGSEEAAQGIIAGPRATAEQKQNIMQFSQNATNAMDASAQSGFSSELFATTLVDKLDLDRYFGQQSPFSTSLGDSLKPTIDVANKYGDIAQTQQGQVLGFLSKIKDGFDVVASGEHWSGLIYAGIGTIIALLAKGAIFDKLGGKLTDSLGKVFGKGGAALEEGAVVGGNAIGNGAKLGQTPEAIAKATSAADGLSLAGKGAVAGSAGEAATLNTAAKTAGLLAKSAKILGPIATIGAGAYEGYQDYKENGKAGSAVGTGVGTAAGGAAGGWAGAAGGAAIGGAVGSVVPIVGTAVGAIVGGVLGAMGGGAAGGTVGGWLGKKAGSAVDNIGAPTNQVASPGAAAGAPVSSPKPSNSDPAVRSADATDAINAATAATATGIGQQVKQLGTSNDLLKLIADLSQKNVDLAEKQLIALTLTDTEKADQKTRGQLRKDNKFGSQYNYV